MTAWSEQTLVFECAGEQLLGVAHRGKASTGVLVVVGGPQYRVGSHRQFVLMARDLAKAGYPVTLENCGVEEKFTKAPSRVVVMNGASVAEVSTLLALGVELLRRQTAREVPEPGEMDLAGAWRRRFGGRNERKFSEDPNSVTSPKF